MLSDFLFSIAGKPNNERINSFIDSIIDTKALQPAELQIFNHTIKCAEKGNYPSREYYHSMGFQPINPTNSLSEIAVLVDNLKDFLRKEKVTREAFKSINTAMSYKELTERLQEISTTDLPPEEIDLSTFSATITDIQEVSASEYSFKLGISDIDSLTGGFQPGSVASICAFVGCGKSTVLVSSMFKNIKDGKKGVYFSLEVAPSIVKLQFFSRYCYDLHSFSISPKDIMEGTLTESEQQRVDELLPQFNSFIADNLLIVDESLLSESLITDFKKINNLYQSFNKQLGSLDFVGYDHVNQIDLMFKDLGNVAIRNLTSAGKTFIGSSGKPPVTLLAVQVNREGYKRACKRNGKYDIVAIGDLNECAHSSTTIYTTKSSTTFGELVSSTGDTYVKSVDYNSGKVIETKVKDKFITGKVDTDFEWRYLKYNGSPKNMIFTPSHKFLINGKKIPLRELPSEFYADSVNWVIPDIARQVLLGTLLGNSVISFTQGVSKQEPKSHIRLLQGTAQKGYLEWKSRVLGGLAGSIKKVPGRNLYISCTKSTNQTNYLKGLTNYPYKLITEELLKDFGEYSLLTWFLDDGCKVNHSKNCYTAVFACTSFGEEGALLMQKHLLDKFGLETKLKIRPEKRSIKPTVRIELGAVMARKLMSIISPLIDEESINYKLDHERYPYIPVEIEKPYIGVLYSSLKVTQEPYYFKEQKHTKLRNKYNFEVEHHDKNYILPGGLVSSNCERSSVYLIFFHSTDDLRLLQETRVSMLKHRYGACLTEPVSANFNAASFFVGEEVETVTLGDFSFLQQDLNLNVSDDEFDEF